MKIFNKSNILAIISLCGITSIGMAATINDGTLTYSTSGTNATVTGLVSTSATVNNLTVPTSVTDNGTTYTVTAIAANAFQNATNLTGELSLNNISIGESAFSGSGIQSVVITYFNSATSPNNEQFTTINPSNYIGSSAFANCSKLTSVYLGFNSSTSYSMPTSAFSGCTALKTFVYTGSTLPAMGTTFGSSVPTGASLYVLSSNVTSAKSTTGWKNFSNIADASTLITGIELDSDLYVFANTSSEGQYATVNALPNKCFNVIVHNAMSFSYTGGNCTVSHNASTRGLVKPDSMYGNLNAFKVTYGSFTIQGKIYVGTDLVNVRIYYNGTGGFYVQYQMPMGEILTFNNYPYYNASINQFTRTPAIQDASLYVTNLPVNGGSYIESKGNYSKAAGSGENGLITFNITYTRQKDTPTDVESVVGEESPVVVLVSGHNIVVEGADDGDVVTVTNIAGQTVYSGVSKSVNVAESGIYIVTVGNNSQKVVVK